MATDDARWTTLRDFGIESSVVANDHVPRLHPRERFVRCQNCGATAGFSATAAGPIRRALESLAGRPCEAPTIPDDAGGEHRATVTTEHPSVGRYLRCESCGRGAPLDGNEKALLDELSEIPCIDRLSYAELLDMLFSPSAFTPPLSDLGITNWRGRDGEFQDDISRVFRHERFQFTIHLRDVDGHVATVAASPSPEGDSFGTLRFPSVNPSDPVARSAATTLVQFLSATDGMTAGDLLSLKNVYEEVRDDHRQAWLDDAYDRARDRFEDRFDDSPAAFSEAFDGATDDRQEILRRLVGTSGFDDPDEATFAREMLGHDHEFPGFIDFVAESHDWSPPVPDS